MMECSTLCVAAGAQCPAFSQFVATCGRSCEDPSPVQLHPLCEEWLTNTACYESMKLDFNLFQGYLDACQVGEPAWMSIHFQS